MKKLISLLIGITLLFTLFQTVTFAENLPDHTDSWAKNELTDAMALSIFPTGWQSKLTQNLTSDERTQILSSVKEKLANLALSKGDFSYTPSSFTNSRLSFCQQLIALYNGYDVPDFMQSAATSPLAFMTEHHILLGDDRGKLNEDKQATLQEALIIASRFIYTIYEQVGETAHGFLWKAVNGDNTLYLLGTIHTNTVYPLDKRIEKIIKESNQVMLEIDFDKAEEYEDYKAMQYYTDHSTLKDHISYNLYSKVVSTLKNNGYSESDINRCKPWALASMFSNLCYLTDDTWIVDNYICQKAKALGKAVTQCEGYRYQGSLFDGLSAACQENYLSHSLMDYKDFLTNGSQSAIAIANETDALSFQHGAIDVFNRNYDKDAMLESHDELTEMLYSSRDAHMTACAKALLNTKEKTTNLLAVGAGHMVGKNGIIDSLIDDGYDVEVIDIYD